MEIYLKILGELVNKGLGIGLAIWFVWWLTKIHFPKIISVFEVTVNKLMESNEETRKDFLVALKKKEKNDGE